MHVPRIGNLPGLALQPRQLEIVIPSAPCQHYAESRRDESRRCRLKPAPPSPSHRFGTLMLSLAPSLGLESSVRSPPSVRTRRLMLRGPILRISSSSKLYF